MSRRRDLEHHRHSLGEIREIMNSMKTLAYMETHKLARLLPAQRAVVESIEQVAADFLSFYPGIRPESANATPVFLLIGTERGFCGDFNQALIDHLVPMAHAADGSGPHVLAVGQKLHPLMQDDARVSAFIDGASVTEEIPKVLHVLVDALSSLQVAHVDLAFYGIYHAEDGIVMNQLLPPFQQQLHAPPSHHHPPLLNLPPEAFLRDLTDHYLFAALHQMLYTSLMQENRRRMTHLEGAVRHLDEESGDLARQCNALRQEEIIEEIEVILLSAASINGGSSSTSPRT